jgi:hypothetical protein
MPRTLGGAGGTSLENIFEQMKNQVFPGSTVVTGYDKGLGGRIMGDTNQLPELRLRTNSGALLIQCGNFTLGEDTAVCGK